jgi:hypothetical protein
MTTAQDGGKVVRLTHRPLLPPGNVPGTHFRRGWVDPCHYMYHKFNIQQFIVVSAQCIYVFCVDLRTNSDYFPIQH